MKKSVLLLLIFSTLSLNIKAQIDSLIIPVENGLKFSIGKSNRNFVKMGFHTQLWTRYAQLNEGTSDYNGNSISNDLDFIMRRTALTNLIVIDKFKFFTNLTVSSQSNTSAVTPYANKSPQLYFFDIWAAYAIFKNYLTFGGGLHMYNGISRYTSASSMKTLGTDVTLISAPNLLTGDQSARQMGLFATGNINKLSYRMAFNKPFVTSTIPNTVSSNMVYHQQTNNYCYTGYFEYQFLETESNFMPFKTATYLGKKRILNIGAGFYHHPDATVSYTKAMDASFHSISHFAIDIFYENPLKSNSALTLYASKFWFDYGPNYIHAFGIQESFKGSLAEFQYGTGHAYLLQSAYLIPSQRESRRIQPYYELTIRDYDGVVQTLFHHNAGINYFIIGHHLKFSLQYENRPVLSNNNILRKSMLIGKFQFSF